MGYVFPNGNAIGGPVIGHGRYIAQGLTHLDENRPGPAGPRLDLRRPRGRDRGGHARPARSTILKIASAFDVGKVLNEQQVRTQIIGGVVQGIGSALFEEYVFDPHDGRFKSCSWVDYKIPTAKDVPRAMTPALRRDAAARRPLRRPRRGRAPDDLHPLGDRQRPPRRARRAASPSCRSRARGSSSPPGRSSRESPSPRATPRTDHAAGAPNDESASSSARTATTTPSC